jgi:hypothetical protein
MLNALGVWGLARWFQNANDFFIKLFLQKYFDFQGYKNIRMCMVTMEHFLQHPAYMPNYCTLFDGY